MVDRAHAEANLVKTLLALRQAADALAEVGPSAPEWPRKVEKYLRAKAAHEAAVADAEAVIR